MVELELKKNDYKNVLEGLTSEIENKKKTIKILVEN